MSGPWGSESNLDDAGYLTRFREMIEDFPVPADEMFSPNGTATKFKCQRIKLNDDSYFSVTVSNVVYPVVASLAALTASTVYVDYNTGLLTFGQAPPAGTNTVICYHNQVRWRDSAILAAMNDCLQSLFPTIWRNGVDTSITMQVNRWDYTLPVDFFDTRVRIRRLSIREIPSSTNAFYELNGAFDTYGNPPMLRIHTSQWFSPGSTLQIEYQAPFRSLSDLEGQAMGLPLWYAAGMLLGFREGQRTRLDGQTVMADSNAQPPQYLQNSGGWYMSRYREMLAKLARPMGVRRPISVYQQ